MNRTQWILSGVVAVELVAAVFWVNRQWAPRPVPPLPRVEFFDRITAAALRNQRDAVQPHAPRDWAALAERYLAHGFYSEAEACHRQACGLAPENPQLRALWAFCLSRMGQMPEAIKRFREALRLGHPQPAELHYAIGRDHLRLEDRQTARQWFERAGDLPAARYELAKLALVEQDFERAVKLLEPLQRQFPHALAPHWLRARAEQLRGDAEAARRYAGLAASARERLPTPFDQHSDRIYDSHNYFGLSQCWHDARELLEAGRLEDARELLEEALDAQWQFQGADLLADIAHAQQRPEESLELLREILRREEPTLHRLWRYGDGLEAVGRREEAAGAWRHALAVGPETEGKGLYVKLSQYHADRGEREEAERLKARFYCAAGIELFRQGQPAQARGSLEESLRINAEDPDAWFFLGQSCQQTDAPRAARQAYERCLELRPEHGRARDALEELGK